MVEASVGRTGCRIGWGSGQGRSCMIHQGEHWGTSQGGLITLELKEGHPECRGQNGWGRVGSVEGDQLGVPCSSLADDDNDWH